MLFQNHGDLLEEFTQFLPDPLPPGGMPALGTGPLAPGRLPKSVRPTGRGGARGLGKLSQATAPQASGYDQEEKRAQKRRNKEPEDKFTTGTPEEMALFNKIKSKISAKRWQDFVKCLNLFNQEIIGRVECCILVKDLLGRSHDLFAKFREFLGVSENLVEEFSDGEAKPKASSAWNDIDFTTCKRCGPSYRALPKTYVPPVCSGRNELCNSVLNDTWVSVPTGSEDGTFKSSRKNPCEETLFKCEDDRYELDLVIEMNNSTMRVLEALQKKMDDMNEVERTAFRIDDQLDVLQVCSIERMYGEKGAEIVEGLHENPAVAVGVILKRLRQKDQEWRKSRREWNKIWREVNEKNYHKSLDHQSFLFKLNEKKSLAPKVLIAEIKQRYQELLKDETSPALVPHQVFLLNDPRIFPDIAALLSYAADKVLSKGDREKLDLFISSVITPFFKTEGMPIPKDIDPSAADAIAKKKEKDELNGDVQPLPADRKTQLFLGNSSFYVLLRLYQILYERIQKAFSLSRFHNTWAVSAARQAEIKPTDAKTKYQNFLRDLYSVIAGTFDQNKWEDEMRELFGPSGYLLFTLDKLVVQLVKQIQSVLQDETCQKLVALARFDEPRTAATDHAYLSSCHELLGEERCFRFEFEASPEPGRLAFQLLDPANQPRFLEVGYNKQKWSQYVESYTNPTSTAQELDPKKHRIFLLRNHRANASKNVHEKLEVHNGLECKICCNTYKMFYVEDTEDVLHRQFSRAHRQARATKVAAMLKAETEKFRKWQEQRLAELNRATG